MRALAIAATGMNAQQTNMEVIANNIANINTTGFKRARAEFTDLLYQAERLSGAPTRGGQDAACRKAPTSVSACGRRDPQSAHAGRADADRQQARPGAQRARLVPDRRAPTASSSIRAPAPSTRTRNGQLVTLDGYQVQPAITIPHGRARHHRQRDRRGVRRPTDARRHADAARPARRSRPSSTIPASSRWAAISTGDGSRRGPRPSACRRSGLRQRPSGLSREFERRSGEGNHRADLRAARLRDELEGHPGRRSDVRHRLQRDPVVSSERESCRCDCDRGGGPRCRLRIGVCGGPRHRGGAGADPRAARLAIYPGEVIGESQLIDRPYPSQAVMGASCSRTGWASSARSPSRRFSPDAPIGIGAVREPFAVKQGQPRWSCSNRGRSSSRRRPCRCSRAPIGETISLRNHR